MNDEQIREYTRKITQANESALTVLLFDLMNQSLEDAKEAEAQGQQEEYHRELVRTRQFLNEQMGSLDYQYTIAQHLKRIYEYVDRELVQMEYAYDSKMIDDIQGMLNELKEAYQEVAKLDTRGPVMENTQQVYAGLTYGKGAQYETMIDGNPSNRGFRA